MPTKVQYINVGFTEEQAGLLSKRESGAPIFGGIGRVVRGQIGGWDIDVNSLNGGKDSIITGGKHQTHDDSETGIKIFSQDFSQGSSAASAFIEFWNNSGDATFMYMPGADTGLIVEGNPLKVVGDVLPNTNDLYDLGSSSLRWATVFLVNSPDVSSDIRYKKNIEYVKYGLPEILELKPISYERAGKHLGFSAQDVEKVLPEIVSSNEEYSMRPTEIIPVLVKAIQQLSEKVERLEKGR